MSDVNKIMDAIIGHATAPRPEGVIVSGTKTHTAAPKIELLKRFELLIPINTPTGPVTAITLRRPKVSEMVRFQSQAKSLRLDDAEEEMLIYANLTEEKLTKEDIGELDFGDYAKLQRWFRSIQTAA